jgi:hypothetical protein
MKKILVAALLASAVTMGPAFAHGGGGHGGGFGGGSHGGGFGGMHSVGRSSFEGRSVGFNRSGNHFRRHAFFRGGFGGYYYDPCYGYSYPYGACRF